MNGYGYRLGAVGIISTFFIIIFSTVLMPMVLFNPKVTTSANDYTIEKGVADPERGRRVYIREGCFYCHTQFTRLQDREYGPLVKAGDYVYETPHQLGTARTGPDLTNEGGKFPSEWQKAHLVQPRAVKPGSIMPSFAYLNDRDMNDLVAYIQTLGNKRKVEHYFEAPAEYMPTTSFGRELAGRKHVSTSGDAADSAANGGRGIYTQNCAACHGLDGRGNGPNSVSLLKKPANLTRPIFKQYSDEMWFYRIWEGVPGTRMPRWGWKLTEEEVWYLVAYMKTLQKDADVIPDKLEKVETVLPGNASATIDSLEQLDKIEMIKLPKLTKQQYEPHTGDH